MWRFCGARVFDLPPLPRRLCFFLGLFVCVSAGLLKKLADEFFSEIQWLSHRRIQPYFDYLQKCEKIRKMLEEF